MEASRGRRGKKAGWQVSAGVKDVICLGVGVVGLMMMSFALGVLAGRGEIYRVFYQWGLLSPNAQRVAQGVPAAGSPGAPLPGVTAAVPAAPAAAKAPPQEPVAGSIAAAPGAAAAAKKGKASGPGRDQKAKEEEMRRVRQEVVRKLKFQNSLDGQPKAAKATKEKQKAVAPVKMAQFRDLKAAKARMSELQKKGVKVTLKESKDEKGPLYTLYRPGTPPASQADALAQSPEKKRKAQAE